MACLSCPAQFFNIPTFSLLIRFECGFVRIQWDLLLVPVQGISTSTGSRDAGISNKIQAILFLALTRLICSKKYNSTQISNRDLTIWIAENCSVWQR
jgi:hypothetical protein